MTHGGRRAGAGRKTRPNATRHNVYIENWAWRRLGENRGRTIERNIVNTMNAKQRLEAAHERMNELGFTAEQQDFIFTDWNEGEDHINWLLTASREEIDSWGAASNWGKA